MNTQRDQVTVPSQSIPIGSGDSVKSDNDGGSELNRDLNSKEFSQLLPTTFSASEDSDAENDEGAEFDDDINEDEMLQLIEDPNITLTNPNDFESESHDQEGTYRGRPSSCVFVASLAASLTDDQLSMSVTKHFEKWGELALVKVLRDPSNRPYAFVQYTTDEDARRALDEGHSSILDGRAIRCEPAKVNRTLYIATFNGLNISSKDLKDALEEFGEIEQMTGDSDSGFRKSNSNKAWFCKFAYRDDAIRAYADLRADPNWIVEWAQNIDRPSNSTASKIYSFGKFNDEQEVVIDKYSVFVGQLDSKVTKEKLDERFSRHGKVIDIVLVLRPGNNFAFIKFATEKAAGAAVERENHAVFLDKTMHVQYREIHHKKSKSTNPSLPRLNLAPPPVNLPYRRRSLGSNMYGNSKQAYGYNPLKHYQQIVSNNSVIYHPSSSDTIISSASHSTTHGKKIVSTSTNATSVEPLPNLSSSASRQNRFKLALTRSISFDNDSLMKSQHKGFYNSNQVYSINEARDDQHTATFSRTPSKLDYGENSQSKNTPFSSPSNHTVNSSQGENKSLYSSSTVSVLEHQLHEASLNEHNRYKGANSMLGCSPSSCYYYAPVSSHNVPPPGPLIPKDNYLYDPSSTYLAYASYPYYYPNSSLIDYAPSSLNPTAQIQPAPYYMYYSVSQAPGFSTNRSSASVDEIKSFQPLTDKPEELNY
ncbi:hypothetical protein WICMUC_005865 [Wickerhamomyces mucosus]|uniref:RRM domain-containing protein n=1 Tax=Wickerhamomyces mucosus TaxID=1378264 RepID=A0A9P8P2Q1_9ASCO|nr:hypothetical protein WICMUC_005865 [Wickerhamomyces mucosus]